MLMVGDIVILRYGQSLYIKAVPTKKMLMCARYPRLTSYERWNIDSQTGAEDRISYQHMHGENENGSSNQAAE